MTVELEVLEFHVIVQLFRWTLDLLVRRQNFSIVQFRRVDDHLDIHRNDCNDRIDHA